MLKKNKIENIRRNQTRKVIEKETAEEKYAEKSMP